MYMPTKNIAIVNGNIQSFKRKGNNKIYRCKSRWDR